MSRSAEPRGRVGRTDDGFSLVEVVVALGVMAVVVVALLPQLVVGLKSTGTARLMSQAKGVAQGQVGTMRNLPYYVTSAAGQHRDVLDVYYPDLSSPTTTPTCTSTGGHRPPETSWSGFVTAGSSARCSYEPPSGAFFRTVEQVAPRAGIGAFTVVVDTQFLSGSTPPQPLTPRAGYDSTVVGADRPPSSQIGVTVTVWYADRPTARPVSSYTQIADLPIATPRVRAEANATAVEVGSVTTGNGPASLSVGLLNLTGTLTHASTATANLAATSAGLATGEQGAGAAATLVAPPATAGTARTTAPGALTTSGCDLVCWGSSRIQVAPLSVDQALPVAGTGSSPMQALLTDTANNGLSFSPSTPSAYRPGLGLAPPLLRLDPQAAAVPSGLSAGCLPAGTGASAYAESSGYLRTTATDDPAEPRAVESCVLARTSSVSVLPTEFAPRGVVLVELTRAVARCRVQGPDHAATATYDYQATVTYWDGDGYRPAATITPGAVADPLEGIDLATTSVGGTRVLGDYIASWSAITASKVTASPVPGRAEVRLPGVVTIASQPLRADPATPGGDPASVLSLTVGALDCTAEDLR